MSRFLANKSGFHEHDHTARSTSFQSNDLQKTTNTKLDTALVQQTAINTKLDNLSGAINNNIGDGTVKLQTYVYAHDVSNGLSRPLKCDSSGRLECSVDALEITAETINLSTDTLEAKTQAITDKLDSFAGAGNNNVGEGSARLQTYLYARDVSAGNFKPLVCDGDAHLQIDCLSSALPSGAATEAKQDSGITHLATIAGDTTSLDSKVTLCNTGSVIIAASALPSGAATAAKQDTIETTLTAIETDAAALEVLQTSTNTKLDSLTSANHTDLVALEASLTSMEGKQDTMITALQILDNVVSGSEAQVDIVSSALPSGAATESTLASLLSSSQIISEDFTTCNTGAVVLAAGSAAIGKLAANSGVDIGDVDVTSLPLTFNSGNKGATTQRVVIATDDIPIALVNTKLDHLSDNLDTLESSANSIQAAVEGTLTVGSHAVTNAGTFAVQSAATLQAGSAAIGKLAANSGVDIGDVDVTSISAGTNRIGMVGIKANEAADGSGTERHLLCDSSGHLQIDVVSTNLDLAHSATATNTAACAASLTLLDNAVDGNYINVNQNVAGADVAVNSGNKGTSVPRVCIATDDIPIALVNTKLDHLSDNLDTLESSANAIQSAVEGTLTVGSHAVTNAGTFAVQAACSGTVTANLSSTDNAVLDEIQTNGDNIQTKLDTMDSQIDLLEGTNTIKDVQWLNNATISDQSLSDVLDTEGYERVFIYGENSGIVSANNFKIFGSNESAGTYYSVGQLAVTTSDSGRYLLKEDSPIADMPSPRYLKVFNGSGSSKTITKLRAVMSHKLRYV